MSAANLLLNGGFETPVVGGAGYQQVDFGNEPGGFGWTVTTNGVDVVENGLGGMTATFVEGVQGLDLIALGSTGGISQVFATTPGLTYYLLFQYSDNPFNGDAADADVTVTDGSNTLLSTSISHSNATLSNLDWQVFHGQFVATGTSATLTFETAPGGGGSGGIFLDAVVVDQVPEPSTFVLLGAGLVSLGMLRRRNARVSAAGASQAVRYSIPSTWE